MRRLIAYAEKIFHFSRAWAPAITGRRRQPRIPTATVVKTALALFWAGLGSLRACALSARSRFWRHWLPTPMPSADTLGRVPALIRPDTLRDAIHTVYARLKRNKALPDERGVSVAIVDGHESHASYRRHCPGCLERTLHTGQGDRVQYYHRQVTLLLVPGARPGGEPLRLPLDHEPQRPRRLVRTPTLGHRESRLQRTGPGLARRSHLSARPRGDRMLPAARLPGPDPLSVLLLAEPQTATAPGQDQAVLPRTPGGGNLR